LTKTIAGRRQDSFVNQHGMSENRADDQSGRPSVDAQFGEQAAELAG
jgi:hypothetical protein